MPSNEQRRAAAKRKLERRLERQAAQARRRKQFTIAGSVLGVVLVAAAGVGIYYLTRGDDNHNTATGQNSDASLSNTPQAAAPPAVRPKPATVNCTYQDGGQTARPVQKPAKTDVGTQGHVAITLSTNRGPIGLSLDNTESPCTVNSFASLVSQKFFDGTSCHRLTTGPGLDVLQCGDPTGSGSGGPGYQFANEYPTDQFAPGDPALDNPVKYRRGVVAMANSGPNTNGSQFFLVYGDSQLPPNYTIFGTVDNAGLDTLDKVAKAGVAGGGSDGKPAADITISNAQIG